MAGNEKSELIEMKALRPFTSTFECSLADAEWLDDKYIERDGVAVKTKTGKRQIIGLIPVQRMMTSFEILAALDAKLESRIEVLDPDQLASIKPDARDFPVVLCIEHPRNPTFRVPAEIAANLEKRGLAERIIAIKRKTSGEQHVA